jgi:hypothetical protein
VRDQIGIEKPDVLVANVDQIKMECRRATLQFRDDILANLSPAGQSALRDFVESTKSGMTVTMKKSELASYRIPE